MWALLARGLALGGFLKKGKDLGSKLTSPLSRAWDWFRSSPGRTYQPPPAGVKERHDPFSALALLFAGGIAGAINLGAFGEVAKHFLAAINGWTSGSPHPYDYRGKKNYGLEGNKRHWDYSQPGAKTSSFFEKISKNEIKEILEARGKLSREVDGFGINGLKLPGPQIGQNRNG